jgi:hypothetical protein
MANTTPSKPISIRSSGGSLGLPPSHGVEVPSLVTRRSRRSVGSRPSHDVAPPLLVPYGEDHYWSSAFHPYIGLDVLAEIEGTFLSISPFLSLD